MRSLFCSQKFLDAEFRILIGYKSGVDPPGVSGVAESRGSPPRGGGRSPVFPFLSVLVTRLRKVRRNSFEKRM